MMSRVKKILLGSVLLMCLISVVLIVAWITSSPLLSSTMVKYEKETFITTYGDKIHMEYKEHNFPDISCSLIISDDECKKDIFWISDPPEHRIELIEIAQVDNVNVYLSNGNLLFKNTETKELLDYAIVDYIPQVPEDAYNMCKDVLKVFVCSGSPAWVSLYAEPFIIRNDADVINTVVNIGNADYMPDNHPKYTEWIFHVNAMYPNQLFCPFFEEREKANAICKQLIDKYNLEHIGENAIHENCLE